MSEVPCASDPANMGRAAQRSAILLDLERDKRLYLFITLFWGASTLLCHIYSFNFVAPMTGVYLAAFLAMAGVAIALCVVGALCHALIRRNEATVMTCCSRALVCIAKPSRLAGLALFASFALFMGAFTSLKATLPLIHPFWADRWLADLDRSLLGTDAWRLFWPMLSAQDTTRFLQWLYGPVWMTLCIGVPFWFCAICEDRRLRRQFLWTYLAAWSFGGIVMAGVFMSGGPAFYGALSGDTARFLDQSRYLAFDAANPLSAYSEQKELWRLYSARQPGLAAGISDFPSMHVTMATLFALTAGRINHALCWAAGLFATVILISSVHLGWHFLVGDLMAAVLTVMIWKAVGWGLQRTPQIQFQG
jgi:hypothetical protein